MLLGNQKITFRYGVPRGFCETIYTAEAIQRLEVALIHKSVEQASEREIIRIFRINYGLSSDILLPNTPHLIFSFEHSLIFRSNSLFSDILVL